MEIVYRAKDGEIFDTEEECLAHDSKVDALSRVIALDEGLDVMDLTDWEYKWLMSNPPIEFVWIPDDESVDVFNKEFGFDGINGGDFYAYSYSEESFFPVSEAIRTLEKELKRLHDAENVCGRFLREVSECKKARKR